jgi:inward rectifier potassium channel
MDEGRKPRATPRQARAALPRQQPLRIPLPDESRGPARAARTRDVYHHLIAIPWSGFFALIAAAYVVFNLVFALLYRLQDGSIANAPRGFVDAFFFSVQTMATIGYGEMRPATLYGNFLVSLEVLLGMVGFALATGVIFARFSRPTARVMFSKVAVVTLHDGRKTFMFRAANQRSNRILEAQVSLMLVRNEVTAEGYDIRRFHDLKVERGRTPLFTLSWTVMHVVDGASPLHAATRDTLAAEGVEIIVTLVGVDETLSQPIYARHVYHMSDIVFERRLADILTRDKDGATTVDYRRFHDTVA